MSHNIEAIFLDVGNTLRGYRGSAFMAQARKDLMTCMGDRRTERRFFAGLIPAGRLPQAIQSLLKG
jgi:hypothetical protein